MIKPKKPIFAALAAALLSCHIVQAGELLDGKAFAGMIGPSPNPDLPDSLYFDGGHFWSDICTRCGFVPGKYSATKTDIGIAFTGILKSDSRGQFSYDGVVDKNGAINVEIQWERQRWYWTTRRTISFLGSAAAIQEPASYSEMNELLKTFDPDSNPACSRF